MSAAACKTILCGWDAISAIDNYLGDLDSPGKVLRKAATVAKNGVMTAISLTDLLVTQAAGGTVREISWADANEVIEVEERIEHELAGKSPAEAKVFLDQMATVLRTAVQAEHDRVTGEKTY